MKKIIIIHIGMDKNGSKAIQRLLKENQDNNKLNSFGFLYSKSGRGETLNHQNLYWNINRDDYSFWHDLLREAHYSDKINIISFEGLYHLSDLQINNIKNIFKNFDIKILIYIRKHSDMIKSGIAQRFKSGTNKPLISYDFREIISHKQNYFFVIEKFTKFFGINNIYVRQFKSSNPNIFNVQRDFLYFLKDFSNIEFNSFIDTFNEFVRVNPTLNSTSIFVLNEIRHHEFEHKTRLEIVNFLLENQEDDRSTFISDEISSEISALALNEVATIEKYFFRNEKIFLEPSDFTFKIPSSELVNKIKLKIYEDIVCKLQ